MSWYVRPKHVLHGDAVLYCCDKTVVFEQLLACFYCKRPRSGKTLKLSHKLAPAYRENKKNASLSARTACNSRSSAYDKPYPTSTAPVAMFSFSLNIYWRYIVLHLVNETFVQSRASENSVQEPNIRQGDVLCGRIYMVLYCLHYA